MIVSKNYDSGMRHHYVPCECHSMDHTFAFVYFVDKSEKIDPKWSDELYLEVQMISYKRWYRRLWAAIKYVFGYTSGYGHWDSATISPVEAGRIVELLNKFIESQATKGNIEIRPDEQFQDNNSGC